MALDRDAGLDEYFADLERRAAERRARRRRRRPPRTELGWLMRSAAGRALIALVAAIAVFTVIGLVVLWPHDRPPAPVAVPPTLAAHVDAVHDEACNTPTPQRCRTVAIHVGRERASLNLGPVGAAPEVRAGATIRVSRVPHAAGAPAPHANERYTFVNAERRGSVTLALVLVALLAVVVLRVRGLLAVVGVGISLLLLLGFVVPALLAGRPAVLVALVGALAVMFVTVTLTNGLGAQTMAAALGITVTIVLACGLAAAGVHLATLDGRSDDLALITLQQGRAISLSGVVLAGMIIGALGVLADTAVTQASAVMALRHASPELSARQLYRAALAVGRDHLSATIHTLALAYAGAALPVLLIIAAERVPRADALDLQLIAEPAIATAVGCIALIAAVPLTTGLAAALVARIPAEQLPEGHLHTS
jgi:uncharacterized membrane protein